MDSIAGSLLQNNFTAKAKGSVSFFFGIARLSGWALRWLIPGKGENFGVAHGTDTGESILHWGGVGGYD